MKALAHEKITQLAVDLYIGAGRTGPLSSDLGNSRLRKAVFDGSKDEDKATPSRGLNWHFFPANETIKNDNRELLPFIKLYPTSLRMITLRQEKVMDKLEDGASKSLYKALGRVLHHIQDMSTPTHVVPVYHDHKLSDPFESYLCDNWLKIEETLKEDTADILSVLEPERTDDFVALYEHGGKKLLKNLEQGSGLFPVAVNDQQVKVSSTAFWLPFAVAPSEASIPLDIKGFGSFGPLGKGYGNCASFENDGETVPVDQKVYEDIAVFFTRSAVEDTLKALKIFEQSYTT